MSEIDTLNRFGVATTGAGLTAILMPPLPRQVLTRDEALCLAAWLVTLADPAGAEFVRVLQAVRAA